MSENGNGHDDPTPLVRIEDDPARRPDQADFLRQFCEQFDIRGSDRADLELFIQEEVNRQYGEKWHKLMQFWETCRIPRLVIFSTLATQGEMSMVDIAAKCGVSKQYIHKEFRRMEPTFRTFVRGFERRRRFINPKPENEIPQSTRETRPPR